MTTKEMASQSWLRQGDFFMGLIIFICIHYLSSAEVAVSSISGYSYLQTILFSDLGMSYVQKPEHAQYVMSVFIMCQTFFSSFQAFI